MQLVIKHDICYLAKKRNANVSSNLNIDDNYEDLKMMHFIATGKLMKNTRDARTTTIEIPRVIMKEKDTLNKYKNMLRRVRARCNVMNNEINKVDQNENDEEGSTIDTCNDEVVLEKGDTK